jgi:hypothetical protein
VDPYSADYYNILCPNVMSAGIIHRLQSLGLYVLQRFFTDVPTSSMSLGGDTVIRFIFFIRISYNLLCENKSILSCALTYLNDSKTFVEVKKKFLTVSFSSVIYLTVIYTTKENRWEKDLG